MRHLNRQKCGHHFFGYAGFKLKVCKIQSNLQFLRSRRQLMANIDFIARIIKYIFKVDMVISSGKR